MLSRITVGLHASINTSDDVKATLEGVLSPMGDYSHAMTVRQLLDVMAYLESIGN